MILGIKKKIRQVLNLILDFEYWLLGEPIPESWVKVDHVYITKKLIEAFPLATKLYLSDAWYWLCPKEEMVDFLALDTTEQEKYTTEIFDCDDFSFRLMGQIHTKPYSALAFGIGWSKVHAYNIFIDVEGQVWIVEPQTDELIDPKEVKPEYETDLVII